MSDLLNLFNVDRAANRALDQASSPGNLFATASWDQVGNDKELTDFLHRSLDPNGSKYGGDTEALKTDLLNTQTARGSSAIASIWDAIGSHTEGVQKKQFENLIGRLYESAPNRLMSGNLSDTYEAVKSGLVGAVGYDLPLNLLFGAGALSKIGIGGGKAALEAAGANALRHAADPLAKLDGAEELVRLANSGASEEVVRTAIDALGTGITKDLTWQGAKQGAATEAIGGAVGGGLGDIAQQDAAVQRGLQNEISLTSSALNTVGGGVLGGVLGGVGGALEGRGVAKNLVADGGIQREMAGQQRAISDGLFNEMRAGAEQDTGVPNGFVSFADAYRELNSNLRDATNDLTEFSNEVAGGIKSRYTPEQLDVLRGSLVNLQGASDISESLKASANALRQTVDGKPASPEAIKQAQEFEQQAAAYMSFVQRMAGGEFGTGNRFSSSLFGADGDINPEFIALLKRFDRDVAEAFGPVPPTGTASGAAGGTPSPKKPAAPSGSSGEPPTSPPSPTSTVAATPPEPTAGEISAKDITDMAQEKFSADEKQSLADLQDTLAKANVSLQDALDAMKSSGLAETAADIATKSGVDRTVVQDSLGKVTGAAQRETSKAAEAAAPPKAPEAPTATAPKTEEAATPADAGGAADETVEPSGIDTSEDALREAVTNAATMNYKVMVASVTQQRDQVAAALDRVAAEIEAIQASLPKGEKMEGAAKAAKIQEAIDSLRASNPELEPLLDALDATKMTSKQGMTNAKALMDSMAKDAITFTYAKVVGDILPDAFNVEHFDVVIKSMLRDVPSEDVARISQGYKHMVYDAILHRINEIGIDNVMKDKTLGPAWRRIMEGNGGYQQFGGKVKTPVDVGAIINKYADQIARSVKGGLPELQKKFDVAGAAVRDFIKQLEAAGLPVDSDMMRRAVEMKALHAVNDIINGTFETANKEAFDKLAKMRELRARDRAGSQFSRTANHGKNPFYRSMVENPILQRVMNDEGDFVDEVISGRSQPRNEHGVRVAGRPQGILSDGISDYLGTLWAHPRRLFSAAAAARRAIYGAAVDAATWQRGSMTIDGIKFSGSMKELKGRYAEGVQARMEQARFGLILDAVERRSLPSDNPRYLTPEAFEKHIERISGLDRKVSDDELYVAQMLYDSHERVQASRAAARASIEEALKVSEDMGESASTAIAEIVAKLSEFMVRNDSNLISATKDARKRMSDAVASSRKKAGENSNTGKSASYTAGDAKQKMSRGDGNAAITEDGTFVYGTRDADPIIKKANGGSYEFVPRDIISFDKDGTLRLFGEKIGTWKAGEKLPVSVTIDGLLTEEIADATSLVKRKSFLKHFTEKFDKNINKATQAASDKLDEGAQIGKEVSETKKVDDAINTLNGTSLSAHGFSGSTKIGDIPVGEGKRVILKNTKNSQYMLPGEKTQAGSTIEELAKAKKWDINDIEVRVISAGRVKKNGELAGLSSQEVYSRLSEPYTREGSTQPASDEVRQAVRQRKESAPLLVQAQHRPLSQTEAESIKLPDGRSLMDIIDLHDNDTLGLNWRAIPDVDTFDLMVDSLKKNAELIEKLIPHGVKRNNASRRTSFHFLEEHMAKFSPEERMAALDILRRMDAGRGQLPYFKDGDRNSLMFAGGAGKSTASHITIGQEIKGLPQHINLAHEIGHWGFLNLLSPTEKVEYIMTLRKYFPANGGKIDEASILKAAPSLKAVQDAMGVTFKGATSVVNELFAWNFASHTADVITGGPSGLGFGREQSFWQKFLFKARNLLQYFTGQKLDKDAIKLFEKILPSTVAENKFSYDVLIGKKTGDIVTVATLPDRAKVAGSIMGIMERIDTLRGRLGQQLFTPGAVFDAGFEGDLRAAMKHMFGLLYGKEVNATVSRLRQHLEPYKRTGDWERDAKGNVVKSDTKVRKSGKPAGLQKMEYQAGAVDHAQLFAGYQDGKLLAAIKEVVPESISDDVAFDAVAGGVGFDTVVKDIGGVDTNTMRQVRIDSLIEKFKELTGKDISKVPADQEKFYREALDEAERYAEEQVVKWAKEAHDIDISSSMLDRASRTAMGTAEQQANILAMARKLHDLMSDSLDNLESQIEGFGYRLNRSTRELPEAEVTPKQSKTKRAPKKAEPATENAKTVVNREASERTDGNTDGVPAAAPGTLKSLIDRVPHRDQDQQSIIQTMMYRIFNHVMGDDVDRITNADISKIAGIDLEDGVRGEALASTTTAAFDELRKGFRLASEELTNSNRKPDGAVEFVTGMLVRHKLGSLRSDYDMPNLSFADVMDVAKSILTGKRIKDAPDYMDDVAEIIGDVVSVLAGLGKTAEAKRMTGAAEAVTGRPVPLRFENGTYLPSFARASAQIRLSQLPERVAMQMLENLGIKVEGSLQSTLAKNVGYIAGKSPRKVFTTTEEMLGSLAARLSPEEVQRAESMIAKAIREGDTESLPSLIEAYSSLFDDFADVAVKPVLFDSSKVFDPMMADDAAKMAIKGITDSGIKPDVAMKSLGYIGVMEGETARLFSVKSAADMESAIEKATKTLRKESNPDAPQVGEVVLGLSVDPTVPVNPTAIEQRALLAGATEGVAKVYSRFFKKKTAQAAEEGITEEEAQHVRRFRFLQLADNATRLRQVGSNWLANYVAPQEGTGFFEALYSKMSTPLTPLVAQLDKISGVKFWNRTGREIRKNLDMRGHRVWQTETENNIVMAMRTGDILSLTTEERKIVAELKLHFKKMLNMQRDAGINVADVTDASNEFYLPQRMNVDWISANRQESIDMLAEWFKKDRIAEGRPVGDVLSDARRVIDEAINREELQGILDSSSSTYAQAFGDKLHARKLRIVGKDWEKMAPMFDNNLRSLLISYTEAAYKRVEWANRFGVKGHAASTYIDIADRGALAAMEALTSKATGMKYITGVTADSGKEIEFVSTLFSPMAKDEREAASIVAGIMQYLEANGKGEATKAGLVDALTARFEAGGGSGVDHFKKRAEAIVNGLADFGDKGRVMADHEREFALRLVGTLGGRPAYTITANQGARKIAAGVKTFNAVTLLSGALFSSLGDPVGSLMRSGSATAWLKGVSKSVRAAMSDEATMAAMARIGVGMESILSENLSHVNGGVAGRISNAFFQATMLAPWTKAQRQTAALVGFESIKSNQIIAQRERFAGRMDGWKYRKSMRYLRQLGLAELVNSDPLDTFAAAVDNQKVSEAIHRFVNESVFQPNRNDVPMWAQDPIASIFWQFKSYPMMMGRLVKRNFKEAFAMEDGKYAGDPMGLMYLLSVGAAAGAGVLAVKDVISARNEEGSDPRSVRDYKLSKMAQEFGVDTAGMDNEALDVFMGFWANGLLQLGSLGMLGDLVFQSAKQIDNGAYGRERIMSQILGPSYGTFSDTIQIIEAAQHSLSDNADESNAKERNATRKVLKRIPVVGQQNQLVNDWVDTFAGEKQE